MHRTLTALAAAALGLALAVPISAQQKRPASNIDAADYAELKDAIRWLKKSQELDPKDESVRYYMLLVYGSMYDYLSKRFLELRDAGDKGAEERKYVYEEIRRLSEEMDIFLREVDPGVPLKKPADPPPATPKPRPRPNTNHVA